MDHLDHALSQSNNSSLCQFCFFREPWLVHITISGFGTNHGSMNRFTKSTLRHPKQVAGGSGLGGSFWKCQILTYTVKHWVKGL